MEFHEILTQFRSLGGLAENLTLRHSEHGRGLFAINPGLPVRLHVPARLLVSPRWVELDENENIRIITRSPSPLSAEAIAFFEQYQKFFGWGRGGLDSVRRHQRELQALPPILKNFLHILGGSEELTQKPSATYCLQKYFINRQISIQSESRLMPIAELINHAPDGLPYVLQEGVKVSGVVKDEILTRYHSHLDSFHFFINYHFATPANSALSCEVTVQVPNVGTLKIARKDHLADLIGSIRTPQITKVGAQMNLSFVEIANKRNPSQPRKTFVLLMTAHQVPASVAQALFDGLVEHNRRVLRDLIQICRCHPSALASSLERVASFQLTTVN